MRVPTPPTGGRRRAGVVAFVASFATLWLVLPPASAGLIAGEIPAPVHLVDATAVPAPPHDGAATSEGNPEEGASPDRPRAEVLGGFLAANALVVLTAGVLRYGSAATRGRRPAAAATVDEINARGGTGMTATPPTRTNSIAGRVTPATSPGCNLLDYRPLRVALTHRLFPGVLRWAMAAVFALVGYELLAGPASEHDNLGSALMWVVWWPLLPIVIVVLGRFWCAVCPFATLGDWVRRTVGLERPVPSFLKTHGVWLVAASFLALTWSDQVWGIEESPWASGLLVLLFVTAVVTFGALWQRRAFCRYLCFVGGVSGNYARTSVVELRANADVCRGCGSRAACYNGTDRVAGCPLFSFPRTMESTANCNLCGNCIKNCSDGAIELRLRKPTSELWFIRNPRLDESFLAAAIMGVVLVQNAASTDVWAKLLGWLHAVTGISSTPPIFTMGFASAVMLPVGLLAFASHLARRHTSESLRTAFARFGYALIPLGVAGHVAHTLCHVLGEGKAVWLTALPLIGREPPPGASAALMGTERCGWCSARSWGWGSRRRSTGWCASRAQVPPTVPATRAATGAAAGRPSCRTRCSSPGSASRICSCSCSRPPTRHCPPARRGHSRPLLSYWR